MAKRICVTSVIYAPGSNEGSGKQYTRGVPVRRLDCLYETTQQVSCVEFGGGLDWVRPKSSGTGATWPRCPGGSPPRASRALLSGVRCAISTGSAAASRSFPSCFVTVLPFILEIVPPGASSRPHRLGTAPASICASPTDWPAPSEPCIKEDSQALAKHAEEPL